MSVRGATVGQTLAVEWPILDVLSDDERQSFLRACRRRRFARNEVIFHEGDPGDTLHLIAAATSRSAPRPRSATWRRCGSSSRGSSSGSSPWCHPPPRNASAISVDTVETLAVHRNEFDDLRQRHPRVDRLLVEALTTEIRRLSIQLLDALYVPVERRVWRRLSELARVFGDDGDEPIVPLTQADLAQVVGTTRPTVNRLLREGEAAGVIRITRGRVQIVDAEALARRAR